MSSLMHGSKHLKTHTKPHKCQTCTRGFASRLDLQRHIKSQHRAGNEKYRCLVERCAFISNRKDNLRRHQKKEHTALLLGCIDEINDKIHLPDQQSDVFGSTQLHSVCNFILVAASGDLDRLQTFLDAGLEIDSRAEDRSTGLHCAAKAGQAATVKHLLTKGASVNVWNDKRRRPIHEAILSNSPETLQIFLERMTQMDLDASKKEVERYLTRSGNVDIVDVYLTRLGSDFTERADTKKLSFAVRTGHCSLVTALLDDPKVNGNDQIPSHALRFAPIHLAAMLGRTKVMESLITCNHIDTNLGDLYNRRALHIAASGGHAAIVEQLLGHPDVDVNFQDRRGATPLHCAASNGHTLVVAKLIRHPGVNVNCQDKEAAKPIHYAAFNGHWEAASLLLKHSESMEDGRCRSSDVPPISLTFTKEGFLRRLLEHPDFGGPNEILPGTHNTILHVAARKGDREVIEDLLAYPDIDVDVREGYGLTPLMTAAKHGKLEAVRSILQHKDIDVNQTDDSQEPWTALQWAKTKKHHKIVDLLLSHGAIAHTANAPRTVPSIAHIGNSQSTTLQPDHETHFDSFDDLMDGAPTEAWEDFLAMEEGMEE
ncbi:uncharacterized protein J4E78_009434 [Alternaria triticimaculans]|uniref:uncharacterized protein n=1 Tax=Alternaria triticimaculans TaxID=297637 RepID=UPI0020C5248D|nr:uncharacterized protein J4E78_009434 [Alternaria triticimaculans]KAI4645521.1 hypothetical protein J4E78_009434 [Alternaria triticimaculans]